MDDPKDPEGLAEALDLVTTLEFETPRILGNTTAGHYVAYGRDLTEADIAALSLNRGVKPKALQRIFSSHHSLARCLATGMRASQAALVTGYTENRISILLADPSFAGLVADYRAEAKSVFADLAERMNDMSLDAIEILHERLVDNPEGFTIPVLLDLIKAFADRTGHGPGQEVNVKMSMNLIDRPPRETYEEWQSRRTKEVGSIEHETPLKKLNSEAPNEFEERKKQRYAEEACQELLQRLYQFHPERRPERNQDGIHRVR